MERPAIEGGRPCAGGFDWSRHLIGKEEKNAVNELFERSIDRGKAFDRYGGKEVEEYEQDFAEFVGTEYATAVSSGTAALHAALAALRPEPGKEVISAPITDPGAVSAVCINLCVPVFADAEPGTFNMSPESVEELICNRTVAVIVGHIAGEPADIENIVEIANRKGVPVIEDCAQAHGAEYKNQPVGSFGKAGCFSLMSGKHHTAGGQGGMIATDDYELYINAKRFADRGKPFDSDSDTNLFMGLNYRMTELEACVGKVQLKKLKGFIEKRQELAAQLQDSISGLESVRMGRTLPETKSVYWFLRIFVDESKLTISKQEFSEALAAEGIPSAPTYTNIVYKQKWIREKNMFSRSEIPWSLGESSNERRVSYDNSCPNAEKALDQHIMVHFHESLTPEHIQRIAESFAKLEQAYGM